MKRPEAMTQQAFCKLVVSECEARGWTKAASASNCHIQTQSMVDIGRGEFPGDCAGNKKLEHKRKESIMRICKTLGLDIDACFQACGFDPTLLPPMRELLQRTPTTVAPSTVIDLEDLAVLEKSIKLFGSLPVSTALELITLARAKRAQAT